MSEGVEEYRKRIRPFARLELVTVRAGKRKKPASTGSEGELKIALDPEGDQMSSEGLADLLRKNEFLSFWIGGPDGFTGPERAGCDMVLSMSRMTFTGELAQLLLMEQIYRALTIINSHPYHR